MSLYSYVLAVLISVYAAAPYPEILEGLKLNEKVSLIFLSLNPALNAKLPNFFLPIKIF